MPRTPTPRRIGALFIIAIVISSTGAATADARKKRKRCPAGGVAETRQATLRYVEPGEDEYQLVGCAKATGKETILVSGFAEGSSSDGPRAEYWLERRFAAINVPNCTQTGPGEFSCTSTFVVVDLRSGRKLSRFALGDRIVDVVLTSRGSVGLIHRGEVIIAVGTDVRVLESQAEPKSLAYAQQAGRLYWTTAGQPRSAALR